MFRTRLAVSVRANVFEREEASLPPPTPSKSAILRVSLLIALLRSPEHPMHRCEHWGITETSEKYYHLLFSNSGELLRTVSSIAPSRWRRTSSRSRTLPRRECRSRESHSNIHQGMEAVYELAPQSLMDRCREPGSAVTEKRSARKWDSRHLRSAPRSKGTPKRSPRVLRNPVPPHSPPSPMPWLN